MKDITQRASEIKYDMYDEVYYDNENKPKDDMIERRCIVPP